MRNDIAQALLLNVLKDASSEEIEDARKYFQNMAKYKYDDYQQYYPGMRFIERFALWLNQFDDADKKTALEFIRQKLIFISQAEMNLLVASAFPDVIREQLVRDVAIEIQEPEYKVAKILASNEYKKLLRQSLFCGMSDGAKIEYFRRSNAGIISHEQIYLTHELSGERAHKMQKNLLEDLKKQLHTNEVPKEDQKFKRVFLLDDFSASGTSYLKFSEKDGKKEGKGKIHAFYKSIFENKSLKDIFVDPEQLKVYVILYLCTEQAKNLIEQNFCELKNMFEHKPELICIHIIPRAVKLTALNDANVLNLCKKDKYYDAKELEDEHTRKGGSNVRLGFGDCALPVVLFHNTPNNTLPLLWSYDESEKFKGLFPRIPRHKEI